LPRGGYRIDKAFVDLDDVDAELLDARETVAASPKIIQSNSDTEAMQGSNYTTGEIVVLKLAAFCHFKDDLRELDLRGLDDGTKVIDNGRVTDVLGSDVKGELLVVGLSMPTGTPFVRIARRALSCCLNQTNKFRFNN
jgi:hypothetical protein